MTRLFQIQQMHPRTYIIALAILIATTSRLQADTFNIANGDVAGFIAAVNTANANGVADTINLASGGTYVFTTPLNVGSSRVDLQACKLEYSIVSPK